MERSARIDSEARKLALIGGLLGLVPATGLGLLRFLLEEPPERQAQLFGYAVLVPVYVPLVRVL